MQRHNGDYDERRNYSEYSGNDVSQRIYTPTSQRAHYAVNESADDRRNDRNNYNYDERTRLEYEDLPRSQTPQTKKMPVHQNERVERVSFKIILSLIKCSSIFLFSRM